MTPLARAQNFTVEKLKEFIGMYEEEYQNQNKKIVEEGLESKKKGYTATYYQWAGQLGIEYKEEQKEGLFRYHSYLKNFSSDKEYADYLKFWFMTYYAPNRRVQGEENPKLIYCEIVKGLLESTGTEMSYEKFKEKYLNYEGSTDILENSIRDHGKYINIDKQNNKVFIKENEKIEAERTLDKINEKFPIPNLHRNGLIFFERYKYENYSIFLKDILGEEVSQNKILELFIEWMKNTSYNSTTIYNYKKYLLEAVEDLLKFNLIKNERSFYFKDNFSLEEIRKELFSIEEIKEKIKEKSHYSSAFKCFVEFKKYLENRKDFEISESPSYFETTSKTLKSKPHQRIVYGAPGTGKSNFLKEETKGIEKNIERVTFYDGYTHGQFVGAYKPVPVGDATNSEEMDITYSYVAGGLFRQLVRALNNPKEDFVLVIEEINRARADRVFGNIFQLLDRDSLGNSEYPISLSEEQEAYFKESLDEDRYNETIGVKGGLYLPSNLYIWATMNSADQGVYPMDSAFKRRWNFKYIGLDDNADKFGEEDKNYSISLYKIEEREDGTSTYQEVEWNKFRKVINDILLNERVPEDRLLAPFFIKPKDFSVKDSERENTSWLEDEIYESKILMYLFDDVLRHRGKDKIFNEKIRSFSELISKYRAGEKIFYKDVITKMLEETEEEKVLRELREAKELELSELSEFVSEKQD